jgi:hypothetical protein
MTDVVDAGARVIDGAEQRVLVRVLRHAREDLADLDAGDVGRDRLVRTANLGRRVRLHVPRIELARAADQHQHDAVDVARRIDPPRRLQHRQIAKAEAQQRQRSGVQEIAPPQAVAEVHALLRVESEHRRSLPYFRARGTAVYDTSLLTTA